MSPHLGSGHLNPDVTPLFSFPPSTKTPSFICLYLWVKLSRREICRQCSVMSQALDPMSVELPTCQSDPQLCWTPPPCLLTPASSLSSSLPTIRQLSRTHVHISLSKLVDFIVTISVPFGVRSSLSGLAVSAQPAQETQRVVAALWALLHIGHCWQKPRCLCSLVLGCLIGIHLYIPPAVTE